MNPEAPISMYVPARNAEATLAECIAAIRTQTRSPDELFILADPRSTDRTMDIARRTGVTVIEQKGPTLGAARNEAILHARHRWLASCDSDVILEADWLDKLARRRTEDVAGIQGRTNERIRTPADAWRALHMPHHWGDYPFRNPFMLVSEVLFDRNALMAVGGYRDDLNYYEDSDLCQRLRDAGYDLFYEPAAVSTHLRSDDNLSLLNLRWKYSEYRQKQHMDRYAGLLRKIEINREYALTTLARSLSHDREDLIYLSVLLFFHHLILDLRSLHARRPLLTADARAEYERSLAEVALHVLAEHHQGLTESVRQDLTGLPAMCHGAVRRTSLTANNTDKDSFPVWTQHLDNVRRAVDAFCRELGPDLLDLLNTSAEIINGHGSDIRWRRPDPQQLCQRLDSLPLTQVINPTFLDDVCQQWPDTGTFVPLTPCLAEEKKALEHTPPSGTTPVGLAPHLEALPYPRTLLGSLATPNAGHQTLTRLVLCYQPPARFIPGIDILSAGDLASLAGAHGWSIRKFDTLVGRTRLMMERP